jgi:hypothetical protein
MREPEIGPPQIQITGQREKEAVSQDLGNRANGADHVRLPVIDGLQPHAWADAPLQVCE